MLCQRAVPYKKKDYTLKLSKYIEAGVREYWIVDYMQEKVLVYFFESDVYPVIYGFDKPVPVNIYDDNLKIRMLWSSESSKLII